MFFILWSGYSSVNITFLTFIHCTNDERAYMHLCRKRSQMFFGRRIYTLCGFDEFIIKKSILVIILFLSRMRNVITLVAVAFNSNNRKDNSKWSRNDLAFHRKEWRNVLVTYYSHWYNDNLWMYHWSNVGSKVGNTSTYLVTSQIKDSKATSGPR
jgi:hypothetical protein